MSSCPLLPCFFLCPYPYPPPSPCCQVFESMNKALKLSCTKGLPVRVVRSFKASAVAAWWVGGWLVGACMGGVDLALFFPAEEEWELSVQSMGRGAPPKFHLHLLPSSIPVQEKRSSYAPTEETPVRYDGIYRIVKCWRTKGKQVRRGRTGLGGQGRVAGTQVWAGFWAQGLAD